MFVNYVWADLTRNARRTLSTLVGVILGVGLACAVLFFVDGLSSSMTQRAVAPLAIDMQLILTDPVSSDLRLTMAVEPTGPVSAGETITVRLTLQNQGKAPANEVVVRSLPADGLTYMAGSAMVNDKALVDEEENPFAHGPGTIGLNLGTVDPGTTVTLVYQTTADAALDSTAQRIYSTVSAREAMIPIEANSPPPPTLDELVTRFERIEGVASAVQLSYADLARGSLAAEEAVNGLSRIFGFDVSYMEQDPTVKVIEGELVAGEALISAEAAEALGVGIGDPISISLPDRSELELPISGLVDLTQARSLFASRQGENLETFVYYPYSVIVDPATFAEAVLPTFERAITARGDFIKSPPVREIDLQIQRELLDAEPAAALLQTQRIAREIARATSDTETLLDNTTSNYSFLLDNISNTLEVASNDAAVAKRMFLFLSIPGAMLAALLGAYAGIVLAGAQRREQATLRIRGASRQNLLWMLLLRVAAITAVGALVGVALGFASVAAVLGYDALTRATATSLATSAILGTVAGLIATGLALYATGRWAIDSEISRDRTSTPGRAPLWQRYWLDLVGLAAVIIATILVVNSGGFQGEAGSVYEGRAVQLPLGLLFLPIGAWVAGSLFGGRIFGGALSWLRTTKPKTVRPLSLLYWRSLKRRAWSLVDVTLILGMIVALATSLAVFTASYDGAKAADARYTLGADLKIIPSPASKQKYTVEDASTFAVEGVDAVIPVVFGVHNVVLRSERTTEVANLAALDPALYAEIATFDDTHFSSESAEESLMTIAEQPEGLLLSEDMAEFLNVEEGDTVWVLLARATEDQVEVEMELVGLYTQLPGFPDGVDALMNIALHTEELEATTPSFFLGKTNEPSALALAEATTTLHNGVAASEDLRVDTRLTALAKDQSSLASLNINGLLRLDSAYSLAMGTVAIAIFVFGLLLQRRREYVTLRAQGMAPRSIRTFIGAEAGTAALVGCVVGVPVGLVMGYYLISVLRPLFVLEPIYIVPFGSLVLILGSVLAATIITSMAASTLVNQLSATELLRDE